MIRLIRENMEVEASEESPGILLFNAVGPESLPFAVDLAVLQARSLRGGLSPSEEGLWLKLRRGVVS